MFGEFKYSVWALALKLIGVYLGTIIINLLVLSGLLGIFEDNVAWEWFVQVIALLINLGLVFMFASSDGRRDILVDHANEKRAERNEGLSYTKTFDLKKGFLGGLFAQAPFAILYLIWLIMGSSETGMEFFVRVSFSPYFQIMSTLGLNVLTVLLFTALFTGFAGLAYFTAQSHQKKVLTIIKRNEEKARSKGIAYIKEQRGKK